MKNVLEFLQKSATHVFDYMIAQYNVLVNDSGSAFGLKLIDGKPQISNTDYYVDISHGNISGTIPISKIGLAIAVTSSISTDIWSYSHIQPIYVFPTSSMKMEVISDSLNDICTIL